jgi:hypothetical protein
VPDSGTAGWPIEVDGETWRRLKVTFPDHIKSHTRQQISCFGPDGLLRRHRHPRRPFLVTGAGTAFTFIPVSIGALAGVAERDARAASGLLNTSSSSAGRSG